MTEYLTVAAAADYLQCSPRKVRALVSSRRLGALYIGERAYRIPRAELQRFEQSHFRKAVAS